MGEDVDEGFGEADVVEFEGFGKEGGYLFVGEPGDATADAGDVECCLVPFAGQINKVVNVWLDGIYASLHGWDGVRAALYANTLAHYGAEAFECNASCSSGVYACEVATEDEYFIFAEFGYVIGGIIHIIIFIRTYNPTAVGESLPV